METLINSLSHLRRAFVVALICSALPVFGTTFTVTSTSDSGSGSLRDAITNAAASGDTINFNLPYPATITLASALQIRKSLAINGPGSSNLAINAAGNDQVFTLYGAVNISDVTIEGGSSLLGGCIFNASSVILDRIVVQFCNTGNQLGGGIFNGGTMVLANSTIQNNVAGTSSEIGEGGGIYNTTELGVPYGGTLTIINSDIRANRAIGERAGQPCGDEPTGPLTSCGAGGGISNHLGTVGIQSSTVENNDALGGGGIYNQGGTLSVANSTITGNSATLVGSGIEVGDNDVVTIISTTITSNTWDVQGLFPSAVYDYAGKALMVTNVTITGNSGVGLDIAAPSAPVRVAFATIADNANGGIASYFEDPFLGNTIVQNSILSNNGGANCIFNPQGLGSLGHNLSDDASCTEVFNQLGDLNSTAAGLDPGGLRNNGGPTQTIALVSGSPAINAVPLSFCTDGNGQKVTTDQRSDPRPQGTACDMGAVEWFQSVNPILGSQTYTITHEVQQLKIASAPKATLLSQISAAVNYVNHGENTLAIDELKLFVSSVDSLERSKVITLTQTSLFTTQVQALVKTLSGGL